MGLDMFLIGHHADGKETEIHYWRKKYDIQKSVARVLPDYDIFYGKVYGSHPLSVESLSGISSDVGIDKEQAEPFLRAIDMLNKQEIVGVYYHEHS